MPNTSVQATGEAMPKIKPTDATTFTARDFPLEAPAQEPEDDLFEARTYLRILEGELERSSGREHGMPKRTAADMLFVIGHVETILDKLQEFFDHADFPLIRPLYQEVRRAAIMQIWERTR